MIVSKSGMECFAASKCNLLMGSGYSDKNGVERVRERELDKDEDLVNVDVGPAI